MHEEKYAAIKGYLAEKFPGGEIEQKHDFDRGAQSFKLHIVDDSSTPEILRLFSI